MHKFSFKNNRIIVANNPPSISYGEGTARVDNAIITNSNEFTKQQEGEHYKTISQPFALFYGKIRPADTGPGKTVEGSYDIWHSDMDGDGVEDRDKNNQPIAKKAHNHLLVNSSDTYTQGTTASYIRTRMPLSGFPAESRIHNFMKNFRTDTGEAQDFIYAYTPTEIYEQILANNQGIARDISTQDRVAAVATARTQQERVADLATARKRTNLSPNITDIEDPVSLVLTHKDPLGAVYEGLMYPDAALGIFTEPEHMQSFCDCGDKEDNHTTKKHTLLPRTMSVNGQLVDGRNHRSVKSPTRSGFFSRIANGIQSMSAHEHLKKQGIKVSPEDTQMVVRIGVDPEVVRCIYHYSTSTRHASTQGAMLPAIAPKTKLCKICEGSGKHNMNQRDSVYWDQDIDPDAPPKTITTNAETGKLMLIPATKPSGAINRIKNIFTTTPDNVCKDCDGSGYTETEGKPRRRRKDYFIGTAVYDKIGNIITAAKMKSTDRMGWLPNANVSCATCGGDNDYRDNDMPCRSCRIGNLTSTDTNDPVAPTGSRYIHDDGITIPMHHFVSIINEVYGPDSNPHRIINDAEGLLGKRIMPGDTEHTFTTKKNKRTGKTIFRGQLGNWHHVIDRLGKPVFKDRDSALAWVGRVTPGITIPQSHLDELNKMAATIRKGPNAKQTSGSEELDLVCKYLKENLLSLPEQSFTAMQIPVAKTDTIIPDSVEPKNITYLGLEQPGRDSIHKSIFPGIAAINKQRSELLDGDDSEIDNKLNVFYDAVSQAAASQETSSDIPEHISNNLNASYKSIVDHLEERYPETSANLLKDSFSKMIFPFIKKQSKTGDS